MPARQHSLPWSANALFFMALRGTGRTGIMV
jgi:hypothetical protein